MTFVPPSPMVESRKRLEEEEDRKLSIGSASSFDEDPDDSNMLGLGDCGIRRVSDISHINELRREISGLSHLASEFYEVKKTSDPDNISLDSIHLRVLSRCAKYAMIESKSDKASRYFVIITTSLTIFGISCGFWYKNFSGFADDSHWTQWILILWWKGTYYLTLLTLFIREPSSIKSRLDGGIQYCASYTVYFDLKAFYIMINVICSLSAEKKLI